MTERLLLCGGIGAGKSSVAAALAGHGARVIHADGIGHSVLEPEGEAFADVARRWPQVVSDGRIDRAALAAVVFSDPAQLAELEAITHPAIVARIGAMVAEATEELVAVEVPLMRDFMGRGWRRVVVHAPAGVRRQRLLDRGMDPDDVDARMSVQPDDADWLAWAEFVVDNSGPAERLDAEIDRLLRWLRAQRLRPGSP